MPRKREVSNAPGNSRALSRNRRFSFHRKYCSYRRLLRRCKASAEAARSTAGHTAATARNCSGPVLPHSPASFNTRFPPMENPTSARREISILIDQVLGYGSHVLRSAGMVERGSQGFRAATVPLVHADHVHAQGQPLGGNPEHVLGFARTFQAVDHNDGQRVLTLGLPVAMCQNLYPRLDLDQPRLAGRQGYSPRQEKAGQGLPVPAAQTSARQENRRFCLRGLHSLILNG